MYCENLKKKLNGKLYCKLNNKEIKKGECSLCSKKQFKAIPRDFSKINTNVSKKQIKSHTKDKIYKKPIHKSRNYKIVKLERNRYSIFTDNMNVCYLCGKPKDEIHELIFGKNRQNSMKYGFTLPLCWECHKMKAHKDRKFIERMQDNCQEYFESHYGSRDEFIKIFGQSFIDKHKKRPGN